MEINKIIRHVLVRYPLFGNIITNINFTLTKEPVPAPAFTDGKTIYYKEELMSEYSEEEVEFIISHEILHIALRHFFRNIGKDQDLLNYVEDAIINQLLVRDGLVMPKGIVDEPDALDYSTEELYLKLLPRLEEIKKMMNSSTFHILGDESKEVTDNNLLEPYEMSPQEIMKENNDLMNDLLDDYRGNLKIDAAKVGGWGLGTFSQQFKSTPVGRSKPLVHWSNILRSNLTLTKEPSCSFCEVQLDGIIKKEDIYSSEDISSEIIVDTSGSVGSSEIKATLRECKNILSLGTIEVGFADTKFYGFHEIYNERDIDNLSVIGRGGTDFKLMAESFSDKADNRIIITDGLCSFPSGHPEIIWLVLGYYMPNSMYIKDPNNTNIIFVDIHTLDYESSKLLCLKQLKLQGVNKS